MVRGSITEIMRKASLVFIITIIVLQLILTIAASESPLKIATGFLLVVFLPGYTFIEVVYRRYHKNLKEFEQVALAVPVSLTMNVLLGLLANRVAFIGIQSYVIWMVLLVLSMTLFSVIWSSTSEEIRKEHVFLLVGLIILSVAFGYLVSYPAKTIVEPYLSLSIISGDGGNVSIPITTVVDKPVHIDIQIVHHGDNVKEIFLISGGDKQHIHLEPDDQQMIPYDLIFKEPGYYQSRWDIVDSISGESIRAVHLDLRVIDSDVASTQKIGPDS